MCKSLSVEEDVYVNKLTYYLQMKKTELALLVSLFIHRSVFRNSVVTKNKIVTFWLLMKG